MIRDARPDDLESLMTLTEKVYGTFLVRNGFLINQDSLRTTVKQYIEKKLCIVVERDDKIVGIAAWQLFPHLANYECIIFQETLWCLDSPNVMDASILLKAIERKAIELKANIIILGNLAIENEPQLRRIYSNLGYEYLETQYAKPLGG